MQKPSHIRVSRKGQVTIPIELRSKLGIDEGAILEIKEEEGTIMLKLTPHLKAGKPVDEEEYRKIISELDEGRRYWRWQTWQTSACYLPEFPPTESLGAKVEVLVEKEIEKKLLSPSIVTEFIEYAGARIEKMQPW